MLAAAVLVLGFGLSACGSDSGMRARAAPKLPRREAASLASRSDVLAAALRRGDGCAARIQMHGLERQTRLAIVAGRVPAVYRARLLAAEQQLAARVPRCAPPSPPPPPQPPPPPAPPPSPPAAPEKQHGDHAKHDKKHGQGHGHGHGGEGD